MEIDISVIEKAYHQVVLDVIYKLKESYPKVKINTKYKIYRLDDNEIYLYVENNTFVINIDNYLDNHSIYGFKEAFQIIKNDFQTFLDNMHN